MRASLSLCVLALAQLLAACAEVTFESTELAVGDQERFELEVQPQLLERCASGGCHAKPARPFSLYAPGALRMDATRTFLDEALSAEESAQNALHAAAFALGEAPDDSLLLCKPLAVSESGCAHGGGEVFRNASDPLYRAIAAWLDSRHATDAGSR